MSASLLAPALLVDAALGEPGWLWNRWPHPAVLMGRAVEWLDRRLNRGANRKAKGVVSVVILCLGAGIIGGLIAAIPDFGLLELIVAAILLAQRSLTSHVRAVANALRLSLADGRRAVAMIVGRDTAGMTRPDVARAAIESAAENLSDGVIAPAFWFVLGGLPGMMLYKVINTADSMVGHRTPQYESYGWASARLDDVLNWIPARLTAVLIAVTHGWFDSRPIRRDAVLHRSPNAGWPEAAMAGALGIALAGPRSYGGVVVDDPFLNDRGAHDATPGDIGRALRVLTAATALGAAGVAMIALYQLS